MTTKIGAHLLQPQAPPQPNTLDDYGYPYAPDTRRRLRKLGIRGSKGALRLAIAFVLNTTGAVLWLSRTGRRRARLTPRTFHPRQILVARLDLIGDLVLSLTAVRALKRAYPDAAIDLLALPASAAVVAADPDIAAIIPYDPNVWRRPRALFQPRNWRTAYTTLATLRARRYDLALSIFGDWAAILCVLSGARRRVGFGRESYFGFMTDSVPGHHWNRHDHKHEVDYCLELARAAGATTTTADRVPHLPLSPESLHDARAILNDAGVQADKPLIACHVGSNNGQSKRWPVPYWATLLDRVLSAGLAQVVITGAPNDLPLIERITARMTERPVNLAGKTTLIQLAALLSLADLMISGDSGPMHIAGAVGIPLIAIHGPTDPALSGPVGPHATIVRSGIWCSPCYRAKDTADCRFFTTQCMKNILPSQLFTLIQQKLTEYDA